MGQIAEVLVVQHDQEFIAPFDLPMVLCTMTQHREVKYVGLSSTLDYCRTSEDEEVEKVFQTN